MYSSHKAKLSGASDAYLARHRLVKKLAAGDPTNSQWQRDLSVSYEKLGDVAVAQGQLERPRGPTARGW